MVYKVVLEPAEEGGYTVYCPALPGCISEGNTRDEALVNIREAVMLYLRAMERENLILAARGEIEIAEVAV
ncbi:MAG: type II toxin-antitoxin system HicB family antitoxin [Candidatus Xenobiia bacterium LiM19]